MDTIILIPDIIHKSPCVKVPLTPKIKTSMAVTNILIKLNGNQNLQANDIT